MRNLRADLAATDLLHSTITTTKAPQAIDRALLAQVCSLLPSSLPISNTLLFQLDSATSLQHLHLNTSPHHYRHHALPCECRIALRYPPLALLLFGSTFF